MNAGTDERSARRYTKRKRAETEAQTRLRIVETAVDLHQTQGGDNTTISEIARKAGVGRATLYRHFPDELSLLSACTSHYLTQHPPPDPETWAKVSDPGQRLELGLTETYAYHRETERMMAVAEREVKSNPVLASLMEPLEAYWARARQVLAAGWTEDAEGDAVIEAYIGLALSLSTWQFLTRQGLSDTDCVRLFLRTVVGLASRQRDPAEAVGRSEQ